MATEQHRFAQLSKILLLCDLWIFSNVRSERRGVVRNCHRHSIKRHHGQNVNEKKNVEKTTKIIEMRKREVNGEERMFEKSYIYS